MMKIDHRTGSEGPRHDPYGYQEWTVTKEGRKAKLHLGLACWASIEGDDPSTHHDDHSEAEIVAMFEKFAGCSLEKIEERYWKSRDPDAHAGPHVPLNLALHHHLISLGYTWTRHAATWEDVGGCESGPCISGGPAFDEYVLDGEAVYYAEDGTADQLGVIEHEYD